MQAHRHTAHTLTGVDATSAGAAAPPHPLPAGSALPRELAVEDEPSLSEALPPVAAAAASSSAGGGDASRLCRRFLCRCPWWWWWW